MKKLILLFFLLFFALCAMSSPGFSDTLKPAVNEKPVFVLSERDKLALRFTSGPGSVSIVQLFTSDADPSGNSALLWMTSLKDKESAVGLWKTVFPVALHLHLADNNGFKDPFAKSEFDDLAKSYAKLWGTGRVYIPTVAVNGVEWSGWSRGQDVPPAKDTSPGILKVDGTEQPGIFKVLFTPAKGSYPSLTLHAALLGTGLQSRPADGKNRGNTLVHDFIPILYKTTGMSSDKNEWKASVELQKTRGLRNPKYAVIFWLTQDDITVPLQATGGYLPD